MDKQFLFDLQNAANKLRVMWGNNPDSDVIDKAVELLTEKFEESQKTTTRAKKA